ncbi:MAG: SocA family protein [Prevotella sp.]|jgi:uncharacterized phage-associated protein|nr:SocA family protein [Prevotella sp.]
MNLGMQINKDLIGNLIILLADRCRPLYHTKLVKLLFFIDQEATITKGTPITWLDYKAWRLGPVSPELYYSKNKGYNKFSRFVSFESSGNNNAYIVKPVKPFDDSEFSELDLEIIDGVIDRYGKLGTGVLVQLTHEKGTLWDKAVHDSDIRFGRDNQTSDKSLNFLELIDNDDYKKSVYYSTLENLELKSTL